MSSKILCLTSSTIVCVGVGAWHTLSAACVDLDAISTMSDVGVVSDADIVEDDVIDSGVAAVIVDTAVVNAGITDTGKADAGKVDDDIEDVLIGSVNGVLNTFSHDM